MVTMTIDNVPATARGAIRDTISERGLDYHEDRRTFFSDFLVEGGLCAIETLKRDVAASLSEAREATARHRTAEDLATLYQLHRRHERRARLLRLPSIGATDGELTVEECERIHGILVCTTNDVHVPSIERRMQTVCTTLGEALYGQADTRSNVSDLVKRLVGALRTDLRDNRTRSRLSRVFSLGVVRPMHADALADAIAKIDGIVGRRRLAAA